MSNIKVQKSESITSSSPNLRSIFSSVDKLERIDEYTAFGFLPLRRSVLAKKIASTVEADQNGLIIGEFGVGSGKTLKKVITKLVHSSKKIKKIYAIDQNAGLIKKAQIRDYKVRGINFAPEFLADDIMVTPIEKQKNFYDLVVCSYVFSHVTDSAKLVQNCYDLIKDGGYIAVIDYHKPKYIFRGFTRLYMQIFYHRIAWALGGVDSEYRKLSKQIIRFQRSNTLHYLLENCGFKKIVYQKSLGGNAAYYIYQKPNNKQRQEAKLKSQKMALKENIIMGKRYSA